MSLTAAIKNISKIHRTQVTVGVQGTARTTADGEASPADLVEIGSTLEFGTRDGRIQSRPWLRTALRKNGAKWSRGFRLALSEWAGGNVSGAMTVLRQVGVVAVGDVQAQLRAGPWVTNADSTVERKGSDQPLVDTGQLVQSQRAQIEVPGKAPLVVA